MEMVKSYDSEEESSDIEEIDVTPKKTNVQKEVDVIDLDSDDDLPVQKSSTREMLHNRNSNVNKEIDCIELDDGDSPNQTVDKGPEQKKSSEVTADLADKKIDYLNLEDSESDTEPENSNNNVNTLKDYAFILNDDPVGPLKPSEKPVSPECFTETLSYVKESEELIASSSNVDANCNSAKDISGCRTSLGIAKNLGLEHNRKHFKGDAITVASDANNTEPEEKFLSIYREDDRIIREKSDLLCRIPRQIVQTHTAHSNVITSLNWCIPKFSYLFLSSSLDGSVKIWDLFRKNFVQCIESDYGFSACKWSLDGGQIIAGGKGKKAHVFDVESAKKIVEYDIYNIVTSIEAHPYMEDVFLCGTRNAILGFDIRVNTLLPIRSYFSKCEEVLDIAFVDENEFLCSTNVVSQDSADRTIMAWHFSSGAKLSNQIYLERFTCPSLKVNPIDPSFIAQTNGNYILSFSATKPYKRKNKRYVGHKVSGYGIECDISPDGKYVVSGDAEGSVYFYNYSNANTVFIAPCQQKIPVNRVKWHPTYYSTVITATYDGQINIWK